MALVATTAIAICILFQGALRSLTTVLVFDLALHGCLSWPVCQDTITAGGQHACSISEGTFKLETPGSASVEDLEVEAPVGSSRPLAPAGLDPGFGLWLGATEGSLSSQEAGSCLRAWQSSTMFGGSPTHQAQQPAQTWPGWGSPLLRVSEDQLDALAVRMDDSIAQQLREKFRRQQIDDEKQADDQKQLQVAQRIKKVATRSPGERGAAKRRKTLAKESEDGGNGIYLEHLTDLKKYFMIIDPNQKAKYDAFIIIGLYAQIVGCVTLRVAGTDKVVKKWSLVRMLQKADAYKAALLAPRPSDADFAGDDSKDGRGFGMEVSGEEVMSESYVRELVQEVELAATEMEKYFASNRIGSPMLALASAATALNQTMLAVLTSLQHTQAAGKQITKEFAAMCLAGAAATEVSGLIPYDWDRVLEVATDLASKGVEDPIRSARPSECKWIGTTWMLPSARPR